MTIHRNDIEAVIRFAEKLKAVHAVALHLRDVDDVERAGAEAQMRLDALLDQEAQAKRRLAEVHQAVELEFRSERARVADEVVRADAAARAAVSSAQAQVQAIVSEAEAKARAEREDAEAKLAELSGRAESAKAELEGLKAEIDTARAEHEDLTQRLEKARAAAKALIGE